jgi:transketolase
MRNAFIEELVALAAENDHIALVVGDLGYSVIEPFADRFPDRFINAGVAEQNMTGLAAGMASEGYHVFTYSIANFPTFRCAEQIRNDIDYHQLPVTVVAVGGGLAYGALGYSHHAVQDYALIRSMPNMLIAAPGDPMEVRACLRYLVKHPQPSYLRLGKAGEPCFHSAVPEIAPGRWLTARDGAAGGGATILTTGSTLELGMQLAGQDAFQDCAVHSLPLWGQRSKPLQIAAGGNFDEIITLEDHLIDGGFGSWMMEALAPAGRAGIVLPSGLATDVCAMVGSQAALNAAGRLGQVQRRARPA